MPEKHSITNVLSPKYTTDNRKCAIIVIAKATEILFLVLRILFFKNRVGGRNKIKNKIFLQVPVHIEYWIPRYCTQFTT